MIYEIYSEKKQTEASGFPSGNQSVCFPFTHPGLTDTLRVPVWASFAGQPFNPAWELFGVGVRVAPLQAPHRSATSPPPAWSAARSAGCPAP